MARIDLNCDLGEGCGHDAELLALIQSANIACGFHAGDAVLAHQTLALAAQHGVHAGAHPSFPDRADFGRREMERTEADIFADCVYQIGAVQALAQSLGTRLYHVKPHGALYNMAYRAEAYARPIIAAAAQFHLPVMGLPGSHLQELAARSCGFLAEGFADRRYLPDGSLVPRTRPDAFVTDIAEAVQQAQWLVRERGVQTLCVHGDNPQALAFVRALRQALEAQGFVLRACT